MNIIFNSMRTPLVHRSQRPKKPATGFGPELGAETGRHLINVFIKVCCL